MEKKQWKGEVFISGNQSSSAGIGIFINNNVNFELVSYKELKQGRLQMLKLDIEEQHIILINIYGPNRDDIELLNIIDKILIENNDETFIIGGDFNTTVDNSIDKLNGNLNSHKNCSTRIKEIIENNDLCDVWRLKNPNIRQFTWHSNHNPPVFCRLDYFLVSSNILNSVSHCKIKPSFKSDHSTVILELDFIASARGPGYFKINNSILADDEFKTMARNSMTEIIAINSDSNPNTLWELIKGAVRNAAIKYSSKLRKSKNAEEINIQRSIQELEQQLLRSPLDINIQTNLNAQKERLNDLIEDKMKGLILRTRAEWIEGAEKNTKYFASIYRA